MRMAQVLEAEFIPPELIKRYSDEKIARMQEELAEILDDANDRFNKLHFTYICMYKKRFRNIIDL